MAPRAKGIVIPISSTDNTGRAFESVNQQVSALKEKVASLQAQLRGGGPGQQIAEGMEHAVPQVAAASGAIRELEGALPVRAIERFLVSTLGLGPALQAAFPLIGAIAFTGAIAEGIGKVAEMKTRLDGLGKAVADNASEIVAKEREKADSLAVTNDKLEEQIAKFEHKPANGLATAADEARVEIDKLDDAIRGAETDAKKLFDDKFKVGFFDKLFGTESTEPIKKEVLNTLAEIEKLRQSYSQTLQEAQNAGNSPEHIDEIKQSELSKIQAQYDASTARLRKLREQADDKRYDAQRLGGNGKEYDPLINSIDGSLNLYAQQQRVIGQDYRGTVDAPKAALARTVKSNGDTERKAEAERRARAEAEEKAAAAARALADATARSLAASQKAGTDTELDQLESAHRALLVSDEDYYRQREAIQAKAIANQRALLASEKGGLVAQVASTASAGAGLTGNDKIVNDAKIVELRAKIIDLDVKDAALTGEAAKNTRIRADAETDLAKRRLATADSLAAQLEAERGGGTAARARQSRDQYTERRASLAGSSPQLLADLDTQQGLDQDNITTKGAEQDLGAGDAGRQVRRRAIDDELARGQITARDAQRAKIALDKEEADAMQPLLAAYQQLARDGDLAAVGKVAELQQKIGELKNPVNEVAATIRSQLDSAFEGFFENLSRGRSALKSFGDAIQKDLTKDVYQQLVRPGVQSIEGILVPNRSQGSLPGGGGFGGAFGNIASKLPGLAGIGDKGKQSITVKIINQGTDRVQDGEASVEGFQSAFEDKVINIVLRNAAQGGVMSQIFG